MTKMTSINDKRFHQKECRLAACCPATPSASSSAPRRRSTPLLLSAALVALGAEPASAHTYSQRLMSAACNWTGFGCSEAETKQKQLKELRALLGMEEDGDDSLEDGLAHLSAEDVSNLLTNVKRQQASAAFNADLSDEDQEGRGVLAGLMSSLLQKKTERFEVFGNGDVLQHSGEEDVQVVHASGPFGGGGMMLGEPEFAQSPDGDIRMRFRIAFEGEPSRRSRLRGGGPGEGPIDPLRDMDPGLSEILRALSSVHEKHDDDDTDVLQDAMASIISGDEGPLAVRRLRSGLPVLPAPPSKQDVGMLALPGGFNPSAMFGSMFGASDEVEELQQAAVFTSTSQDGGELRRVVHVVKLGSPEDALNAFFPRNLLQNLIEEQDILKHIMADISAKYVQEPPTEFKDPVTDALLDEPAYIYWPSSTELWKKRAFEMVNIKNWFNKVGTVTNPANDEAMGYPGPYQVVAATELKEKITKWKAENARDKPEKTGDNTEDSSVLTDTTSSTASKGEEEAHFESAMKDAGSSSLEGQLKEVADLRCPLTQTRVAEMKNAVTRDGITFFEAAALEARLEKELRDPIDHKVVVVRSEYISTNELAGEFAAKVVLPAAPMKKTRSSQVSKANEDPSWAQEQHDAHDKAQQLRSPIAAARALRIAGQRFSTKSLSFNAFKSRAVRIFTNGGVQNWEPTKATSKRVLVLCAEQDEGAEEKLREQFLRKGFNEVDVKNFKTPSEFIDHKDFHAEGYDAMYDLGVLPMSHRESKEKISGFWGQIRSLFMRSDKPDAEFVTHSQILAEDVSAAYDATCSANEECHLKIHSDTPIGRDGSVYQTRWRRARANEREL
ncbi:unnamed protein product [Amoebophrya sp. A25]|nr:unnamed protein product [Amoebophrya sp. A25]|eukprot:GSA25T00013956001.1